jgi:hypothetical protein
LLAVVVAVADVADVDWEEVVPPTPYPVYNVHDNVLVPGCRAIRISDEQKIRQNSHIFCRPFMIDNKLHVKPTMLEGN